jgi:hypothetical protein
MPDNDEIIKELRNALLKSIIVIALNIASNVKCFGKNIMEESIISSYDLNEMANFNNNGYRMIKLRPIKNTVLKPPINALPDLSFKV